MASLRKDPRGRSPFWFACYRKEDGKRTTRSTETTNRKQAEALARAWERTAWEARHGQLTPALAREIVDDGVGEIARAAGIVLPGPTIAEQFTSWLKDRQIAVVQGHLEEASEVSYRSVVERFFAMLGDRVNRKLETLRPADLLKIRNRFAQELSSNAADKFTKVARMVFSAAVDAEALTTNPARILKKLRAGQSSPKRPFTLDEIRRLMTVAKGSEWYGLILLGFHVGARLGVLAQLRWKDVDLQKRVVVFPAKKKRDKGKVTTVPLSPVATDYLTSLPSSDDPEAFIFPKAAARAKRTGTLSNQFRDSIMVKAGLATKRRHNVVKHPEGEGRRARREVSEVSFHCLRHAYVTALKAGNASDAIARELAGHDSEAVSRIYTHLSVEDLRPAVDSLPDPMAEPAKKGAK
jgi:integrase